MSKSDPSSSKKETIKYIKWVITIFLVTILISGLISLGSEELMARSNMLVAFLILFVIIIIGIVFVVIGMAVATADEKPFHSMAARKVSGAMESLTLLRNAERVSSICNDVIGDICGVVSGSASATIAAQIMQNFEFSWPRIISLLMSALVAGLTVGGKAMGKRIAINSCTAIVFFVGRVIYRCRTIFTVFRKQK